MSVAVRGACSHVNRPSATHTSSLWSLCVGDTGECPRARSPLCRGAARGAGCACAARSSAHLCAHDLGSGMAVVVGCLVAAGTRPSSPWKRRNQKLWQKASARRRPRSMRSSPRGVLRGRASFNASVWPWKRRGMRRRLDTRWSCHRCVSWRPACNARRWRRSIGLRIWRYAERGVDWLLANRG